MPDELRARALARLPAGAVSLRDLTRALPEARAKLRAVIAERLRVVGADPAAELALIGALKDDFEDVQIAAARSLGAIGSISAVEPLHAAADGLFKSMALKSAAADAIEAIQTRAGGGEKGGLSLVAVEDDRGALSLAAERGALSLKSK